MTNKEKNKQYLIERLNTLNDILNAESNKEILETAYSESFDNFVEINEMLKGFENERNEILKELEKRKG